jgi:CubicO group peptidase (beta-lactamase class C family)
MSQTEYYLREELSPEIKAVINDCRESVPKSMKKFEIPGCAVALVDSKGPIWIQGFGYADIERRSPVTADTYFNVWGFSKTITATAIMLAVQDGLLDLDEPIASYLPDFRIQSKYENHPEQKITLKHLLNHTSSLVREIPGGDFDKFSEGLTENNFTNPVGKKWSYSNTGYGLAAYILQTVSGKPFDKYLKERLFIPLGMHRSTVDRGSLPDEDKASGYTSGIFGFKHANQFSDSPIGTQGIYISVDDLTRFVQLHINRGRFEEKQFLDERLLDQMHTPLTKANDSGGIYYGLGIFINKQTFQRPYPLSMSHNGKWMSGGFTSGVSWIPEKNIGIVILINLNRHPETIHFIGSVKGKLIEHRIVENRNLIRKYLIER